MKSKLLILVLPFFILNLTNCEILSSSLENNTKTEEKTSENTNNTTTEEEETSNKFPFKTDGWNISKLDTAKKLGWKEVERNVVIATNMVRSNPSKFANDFLKPMLEQFQGKILIRNGVRISTEEGKSAVEEAIKDLESQDSVSILSSSNGLRKASLDHVNDTGSKGLLSHTGSDGSTLDNRISRYGNWGETIGENIQFGTDNPMDIVIDLLVDDGVKDRGHRKNMFNPNFNIIGVGFGEHKTFKVMCVQDFAGSFIEG